jgi:phosphoribosylpyrophosphate synthetase
MIDPVRYISLGSTYDWLKFDRLTDEAKVAIEQQIEAIATKFSSVYRTGVTVLIPSGNQLYNRIEEIILSKCENGELIEGVICKLTTDEVDDIVLDFNSKFREHYQDNFNDAYYRLGTFLDQMNEERNGTFARHLIKDAEMRDVLDFTLKVSQDRYAEFANKINGQNILIVDDTTSRVQSIIAACKIMMESYAPKSITVLSLLSKLNY